jgi:hypothetical protein
MLRAHSDAVACTRTIPFSSYSNGAIASVLVKFVECAVEGQAGSELRVPRTQEVPVLK